MGPWRRRGLPQSFGKDGRSYEVGCSNPGVYLRLPPRRSKPCVYYRGPKLQGVLRLREEIRLFAGDHEHEAPDSASAEVEIFAAGTLVSGIFDAGIFDAGIFLARIFLTKG